VSVRQATESVPKVRVPSQRGEEPPPRWHTREQMEKVIAAALDPRHRLLFTVAYMTGMRRGELLSREWSDVDLERGEHGIIRVGHKPEIRFRVKIGKGARHPAMPSGATGIAGSSRGRPSWLPLRVRWCRQLSFKDALRRACGRANVPIITQHGTRKTFASLAAMDGMEISTLIEIGGWSTAQPLLEIYAQVDTKHARKAMSSLGFGQEVKEPSPGWLDACIEETDPVLPGSLPSTETGFPVAPSPSTFH